MDILDWFRTIWKKHQDNKKMRELYARLDRNAAGRFSQKKYVRDLNKTLKTERDKKRTRQEDGKE